MRIALPLAALLTVAIGPAWAQDVAPVDGKPGSDIVSPGKIGDVHVVAEPSLAKGRLVLHVVAVNRGKTAASFGPADISIADAGGKTIATVPRETLLAEAGERSPVAGGTAAASAYAAPTLSTNSAGQLDTTGYTGGMASVSSGVPQDTIDRTRSAPPSINVSKLDEVLLKQVDVQPGGVEGGQVVSEKLKLRGDRIVTITVSFAGERHVVRLPAPKS